MAVFVYLPENISDIRPFAIINTHMEISTDMQRGVKTLHVAFLSGECRSKSGVLGEHYPIYDYSNHRI